jgi:hypothetical protein
MHQRQVLPSSSEVPSNLHRKYFELPREYQFIQALETKLYTRLANLRKCLGHFTDRRWEFLLDIRWPMLVSRAVII